MPSASTAMRPGSSSATESSLLRRARPVSVTLKNSRIMRTARCGEGSHSRVLTGDCALEWVGCRHVVLGIVSGRRIWPLRGGAAGLGGRALLARQAQFERGLVGALLAAAPWLGPQAGAH